MTGKTENNSKSKSKKGNDRPESRNRRTGQVVLTL
jgi:hypothetical protein